MLNSGGSTMSFGTTQSTSGNGGVALGAEAAEHERQFRELLEFCPAALLIVDEDGRLLFHNARLREILGYSEDELQLLRHAPVLARPQSARADHRASCGAAAARSSTKR